MKKLAVWSLGLIALGSAAMAASWYRYPNLIVSGQVKVGATSTPDASSILDVSSTTKGILLPRMTTTQRDAISTPATGLEVYNTTTNQKNVYNGTAWVAVGAGTGQGGVNYLILDSSWQPTQTDSSDAENTVGNWLAFADAAASTPVDMTGGSPSTTCLRTTTTGHVIDGAGSFEIVKGAANHQGEGCASIAYIPLGYRTSNMTVSFPFQLQSGSLVSGDLGVWVYDVTNSKLLTNNDTNYWIYGGSGVISTSFAPSTSTAEIRVGLYFASTSTSAVTLDFDDVTVGPVQQAQGMAGSNTTAFTPTGSFTTNTTYTGLHRRIGEYDEIHVKLAFSGAPNAAAAIINMPPGESIDTTKLVSSAQYSVQWGKAQYLTSGTAPLNFQLVPGASANTVQLLWQSNVTNAGQSVVSQSSPVTIGAGDQINVDFTVPIAGWDANVTLASSSTFNISSYLANGTRVTGSAPTALGQYRSYLRNAGAYTFTETNGAPSPGPSVSNGIAIWTASTFAAADATNQPSAYDIFVGQHKTVKLKFYDATGFSSPMDVTPGIVSTNGYGLLATYDESTGIVSVRPYGALYSTTNLRLGNDPITSSAPTSGYFDIVVSNNAQSVGQDTHNVVSGATNLKTEYVVLTAQCTVSPCAIAKNSGGINTVTRTGTGVYSVNFVTGTFSDTPACYCQIGNTGGSVCRNGVWSSTAFTFDTPSLAGTDTDSNFAVQCIGPR